MASEQVFLGVREPKRWHHKQWHLQMDLGLPLTLAKNRVMSARGLLREGTDNTQGEVLESRGSSGFTKLQLHQNLNSR